MRGRLLSLLLLVPAVLLAQDDAAPVTIPSADQQIATAILPLPAEFQGNATVLGYRSVGKLETLRGGGGNMICLADNPSQANFHAACYHESLEPFMKRGRDLRAQGITNVDSLRYPEVESGKLPMPVRAALWSMSGPPGSVNMETGEVGSGVRSLYVVYLPGATSQTTGLPVAGGTNSPWLMFPGTPKAHIMFIPEM